MIQHVELLMSHVSKHVSITSDESAFFISLLRRKSLEAGEFLLRSGDVCRVESFVTTGCFKSFSIDEQGVERVLDFYVEEWWANDLYSFLTQTASKTNIVALEASEVLQIEKSNLELLYQTVPKFEKLFRLLYQNAFIAQREQINLALFTPAEERYLLFTQKKPYAEKRFLQKDIASYLGVTPQFFSSMKRKLM